MSEMIERVAKALYAEDSGTDWDQQSSWVHEMYFKKARAAIKAMQEHLVALSWPDFSSSAFDGAISAIDEALK
jgi:hypothetical protein